MRNMDSSLHTIHLWVGWLNKIIFMMHHKSLLGCMLYIFMQQYSMSCWFSGWGKSTITWWRASELAIYRKWIANLVPQFLWKCKFSLTWVCECESALWIWVSLFRAFWKPWWFPLLKIFWRKLTPGGTEILVTGWQPEPGSCLATSYKPQ